MTILSMYLKTWRQNVSGAKMMTEAFHLRNREAKRELEIYSKGKLLPFFPVSTFFDLNYTDHLRSATISRYCAKTTCQRQAAEATCGLRMGCWR